MKKSVYKTFLMLLLSLASLFSFGQSDFMVGISMGTLYPIGDFRSNNIESDMSGFSENGTTLTFDGDYYFLKSTAISLRFHFGMSSINKSMVSKRLDYLIGDSIFADDQKYLEKIGFWQWSSPMLGLKYNIPLISNRLYIETGVYSGVCIAQVPTHELNIIDELNNRSIISLSVGEWNASMPFMADIALRFKMGNKMQIKLSTSYFSAESRYVHSTFVAKETANAPISIISEKKIQVPIHTLNYSLSLIYSIKK